MKKILLKGKKKSSSKLLTISPSELSHGIHETFMEVSCPSEAGFGIGSQDEARVTAVIRAP